MASFLLNLLTGIGSVATTVGEAVAKGATTAVEGAKDLGTGAAEAIMGGTDVAPGKEVPTDGKGGWMQLLSSGKDVSPEKEVPKDEKGGWMQFLTDEKSPIKKALMDSLFSGKKIDYVPIRGPKRNFTKFGYEPGPDLREGGATISAKTWETYQEFLKDFREHQARQIAEKEHLRKVREAEKYVAPTTYNETIQNYPYVSEDPYSPYYTPPSITDLEDEEYWKTIPPWSAIIGLSKEE